MYRTAQKVLGKGLSPFSRYLLGTVSGVFGIVLIYLEFITSQSKTPLVMYLFGAFCILISLACFTYGAKRKVIGRVIGLSVFIVSLWYLYSQFTDGNLNSGSRGQPSILNAIAFFIFFGLPGIWYALYAKFPLGDSTENENE